MNEERFEEWARAARAEEAPAVDAAAAVLRRLSEERPAGSPAAVWRLAAATGCAAVLAAVCLYRGVDVLFGDCYGWLADFSQWGLL